MKTKTSKWFETVVRYRKMTEDGTEKAVNETYTVDALTFSEAEAKILEYISQYVNGECDVTKLSIATYKEVTLSEEDDDDKFYKCRVCFVTLDEKSGKEKKTNVCYLIQAKSIDIARNNITELFKGSVMEYVVSSVAETKILDVI